MTNLLLTEDGSHTLQASRWDVTYHSKYGALQESQTVFIDAGLLYQCERLSQVSILEIGFGTGLNAFMTYLETTRRGMATRYVGVEAYPVQQALVRQLNYPTMLDATAHAAVFEAMHNAHTYNQVQSFDKFDFMLQMAHFEELNYKEEFDVIYYDAFAPTAQPELWEEAMLARMYEALRPQGVLVTYCAKGAFKRTLKSLGFVLEALAGPKGKREMTRAMKP